MKRPPVPVLVALLLAVAAVSALALRSRRNDSAPAGTAVRVAVLGDSDSHGYRDEVLGTRRGGAHSANTLQWTDVLARTRGAYLDLGADARYGSRGIVARARTRLGLEAKTPRKADYRWNYAVSGARCASLGSEWPWQARWLVSALRAEPGAWRDGIVVIRIGVNDVGQAGHLDEYARDGVTDEHRATFAACAREIAEAARVVRAAHDGVRIIVVGVADDSSWPVGVVPDRSPDEVARMRAALDAFDAALERAVAREDVVFMRDRWYADYFAERDASGRAVESGRTFGGTTPVTNTRGDAPTHLSLADGHAGTVANALFARALIRTMNRELGGAIPDLSDGEIARLADPDGAYGIRAAARP